MTSEEKKLSQIVFTREVERNLLNIDIRDLLFKIMGLCASFSFADMMTCTENFYDIVKTATPYTSEMLNNASFSETKSTRQIQTLLWPRTASLITFRSKSCIITLDEVKDFIGKKYKDVDKMTKTITVRLIDLDWFMKDKMKFLRLTQILNEAESPSIFITEFV